MKENLVTGKKYRILKDEVANIWDRISFWTKASDVELNSGTTVESAIGTINSNISTINTKINNTLPDTYAPKNHAAKTGSGSGIDTPYGKGSSSLYGHVMLSDSYAESQSKYDQSAGIAATTKAVADCYAKLDGDKAPNNHRFSHVDWHSGKVNYGLADSSNFGHVVLRDEYSSLPYGSSGGIAASNKAVYDCYNDLHGRLRAYTPLDDGVQPQDFYFTYDPTTKKYGYKLNGKGTFHPFKSGSSTVGTFSIELTHFKGASGDGWSKVVSQIKVSGSGTFSLTKSIISDNIEKPTSLTSGAEIKVDFNVSSSSGKSFSYDRNTKDDGYTYSKTVSGKSLTYSDGDLLTITAKVQRSTLYHCYAKFEYKLVES